MLIRIQRKRTKGWKMPENTVYVGRPSKWGNPFKVGDVLTIDKIPTHVIIPGTNMIEVRKKSDAIYLYERWINDEIHLKKLDPSELRGKNLACFCKEGAPCHADVLLKIANQ